MIRFMQSIIANPNLFFKVSMQARRQDREE